MGKHDVCDTQTKDEPVSLSEVMTFLRERHAELVGLGVKETYEGCAHAYIESLREAIARYENGRVILTLELTNLRERLARAEEERDDAQQLAIRQAHELRKRRA
jgi:hypothetical protein